MKNKKGFSQVIIIAIVAILITIGVFMAVRKSTSLNTDNKGGQQVTQTQQPKVAAIQNSSDLDATAAELDNTNVDEVDTELNQMDADASTF